MQMKANVIKVLFLHQVYKWTIVMHTIDHITQALQTCKRCTSSQSNMFFKTGPGEYAEHDTFINVPVPTIRLLAKQFQTTPLHDVQTLLASPVNEQRLLALLILVQHYEKAKKDIEREKLY